MNKRKDELGKGIRALLEGMDEESASGKKVMDVTGIETNTISTIPLSQIEVNPFQPRADFDETNLRELSESIIIHGVIQPITVRNIGKDKYQLIAGERRLRASKMAGLNSIPAFIRTANDQETLEIALIENIHREDLNPLEIGINYKRLLDECTLSHEELAIRIGKNRTTVTNYLRLLKLPPDIQLGLKNHSLSMGHARALITVEDPVSQLQIFRSIKEKGLSVRQVEEMVRNVHKQKSTKTKKKDVSFEIRKVQDQLSSELSTKVQIKEKRGGKGEIVISYYTTTDLNRLIDYIVHGEE